MAHILIADDDPAIRHLLRQVLEGEGHQVEDAADGWEAIVRYRRHPADLLITDILMPDVEGVGTIRELLRHYPDAKIVAISGGGDTGTGECLGHAQAAGAHRTLAKPFGRREILAVVNELLVADFASWQ